MDAIPRPAPAGNHSLLLEKVADELLSPWADDGRLSAAAAGLYSLCSSLSGVDEYSGHAGDSSGTRLPSGEAVSPADAARCVLDHRRTSKFLRGLHAAILEARKRFPGAAVEVLYAGCGPFAPLALPLTSRFGPAEVTFTLLDVHRRSLDAARGIFQALGKGAFVRDYVECDAASYRHDAPHAVHVVVVEAMLAALEREPQAAITMNLAPQLCRGGIFLPERITVDCYLCDPAREFTADPAVAGAADSTTAGGGDKVRINLGRVLELTAGACRDRASSGKGDGRHGAPLHSKLRLKVPEDLDGEFALMLLTSVTVFDSIALGECESGLTCPRILYDAGRVRAGDAIDFEYLLGASPGFKYRSSRPAEERRRRGERPAGW